MRSLERNGDDTMEFTTARHSTRNCQARQMDRVLYQCLARLNGTCSFSLCYKNLCYCCHPNRDEFS
ncbi:MAG TPA: hypothetical protein VJ550_00815 [Geomonas sp.]|nr:hypothetical protein [Geomonas sp.]